MQYRHIRSGLAVVVSVLLLATTATAQPLSRTGQPTLFNTTFEPASITGFRNFHFGMSPDAVQKRLAQDFPGIEINDSIEPIQRTRIFTLTVPDLPPVSGTASPGAATLNYVFGASSGQLMAINVDWYAEGNATEKQRQALLSAATAYTSHLVGYVWEPMKTSRGHVIGPNHLIIFAGRDEKGAGVEVRIEGVTLDVVFPDGSRERRVASSGPAQLHIGLSVQPDYPDIFRLPDNAF